VAKDYWRLKDDAKLLDVLYAVRSDETTHRFVNHSLANLEQKTDVNPFALREPDMHVKGHKAEYVSFFFSDLSFCLGRITNMMTIFL
jgi:ubiquinol oxidase